MSIKQVTVRVGQSLFDIVLQCYGDVGKVFEFIQLNSDQISSIMTNNLDGKTLKYEEQTNQVVGYLKNNNTDFSGNQRPVSTRFPEFSSNPFSESFMSAISQSAQQAISNAVVTNPFL